MSRDIGARCCETWLTAVASGSWLRQRRVVLLTAANSRLIHFGGDVGCASGRNEPATASRRPRRHLAAAATPARDTSASQRATDAGPPATDATTSCPTSSWPSPPGVQQPAPTRRPPTYPDAPPKRPNLRGWIIVGVVLLVVLGGCGVLPRKHPTSRTDRGTSRVRR
jgi:hypothetical protein